MKAFHVLTEVRVPQQGEFFVWNDDEKTGIDLCMISNMSKHHYVVTQVREVEP